MVFSAQFSLAFGYHFSAKSIAQLVGHFSYCIDHEQKDLHYEVENIVWVYFLSNIDC